MRIIIFLWGTIAVIMMLIAAIPLLGWLNWILIPFDSIGLIIGLISFSNAKRNRLLLLVGMLFCGLAIVLGISRLYAGCGIF